MRIKNSFLNVGGFVGLVGLLGIPLFATGDRTTCSSSRSSPSFPSSFWAASSNTLTSGGRTIRGARPPSASGSRRVSVFLVGFISVQRIRVARAGYPGRRPGLDSLAVLLRHRVSRLRGFVRREAPWANSSATSRNTASWPAFAGRAGGPRHGAPRDHQPSGSGEVQPLPQDLAVDISHYVGAPIEELFVFPEGE